MHHYLHIFGVTERGQASFCASNVDKCYLKDSWYEHRVHRIVSDRTGGRRGKTFPLVIPSKERESRERESKKERERINYLVSVCHHLAFF